MKHALIGLFFAAALSTAAHAAEPVIEQGLLVANPHDLANPTSESREYSGYELHLNQGYGQQTVYSILVGGNTCGHAIAIGKLMDAPPGTVKLNLTPVEGSERFDFQGVLHVEAYAQDLPDGNLVEAAAAN